MRKKSGALCMTLGALLIAAAIALAAYNQLEASHAANEVKTILPQLQQAITDRVDTEKSDSSTETDEPAQVRKMTEVEIDGHRYIGYLSIPALELELPVMADWDYTRLKKSPCRYFGSVYSDNLVIAAHNYARHFGKLADLRMGDPIRFIDMEGAVYDYEVCDLETLPPTATEEMLQSGWDLSLYTCTLSGGGRVTVRCKRVR